MMAAIGASIASELYQTLFKDRTSTGGAAGSGGSAPANGTQATQGRPPGPPLPGAPPGAAEGSGSIDAAATKMVAELKTMLLGLQDEKQGGASTAASTSASAAKDAGSTAKNPSDRLVADLAALMGSAAKAARGHHGAGSPKPQAAAAAAATAA